MNTNPFLKDGYLMPLASINNVIVPDAGFKPAKQLISANAVSMLVKRQLKRQQTPYTDDNFLNIFLQNTEALTAVSEQAGKNLSLIFLALKNSAPQNRADRPEWTSAHWQFWNNHIENIILGGGLVYGKFGRMVLFNINKHFDKLNTRPYNVSIANNPENLPLTGGATSLNGNGLVLDFGHSFVKRCSVKDGVLHTLPKIAVKHVQYGNAADETTETAQNLDNFIQQTIMHTYDAYRLTEPSLNVAVVIANYVANGKITNKAGYGKLSLLCNCYEEYLQNSISQKISMPVNLKLIHDSTAAAMNFTTNENPRAAVLTLGTSIGVGFVS